ncbi:MAG: hypothetical protein R3E97_13285 [Candidatus Eisenbacteria bacterium]
MTGKRSLRLAWTTAVREEIDDLHVFFQEWFLGEIPNEAARFERVERALGPSFSMIDPDGVSSERDDVITEIRDAHGSKAGETFRIWVRFVRLRDLSDSRFLATYEEWQETEDGVTSRLSSVLFEVRPGTAVSRERLRWLFVHETWRAEKAPADD